MYIRKYSIKSFIIMFFILLLIYQEITGGFSYLDEILALFAWIYAFVLLYTNKMTKSDGKIILGMIMLIFIGVMSNIFYKNVDNWKYILIDGISVTKIFIIYILIKNMIRNRLKYDLVGLLLPISKIYSICAFICVLLSLFIDLGMTGEKRFGIPSFHFIFPMEHQFTSVTIFALCIILIGMTSKYRKYILMNCFSISMTTKGPAIIFCILFIYFLYSFRNNNKIKVWQLITIGIIVLFIGNYQIETYLMNTNAPRAIFIKHGIEIANDNFPLGSGLASFGSPMAAKYYSKLYYQFGFNNLFGMNKIDGSFLYDVGLASIIGQFGWIGFGIYLWILYKILISASLGSTNINKAFVYAVLIQFLIHSVGAAILNSSAAIIAIMGIGMMSGYSINTKNMKSERGA